MSLIELPDPVITSICKELHATDVLALHWTNRRLQHLVRFPRSMTYLLTQDGKNSQTPLGFKRSLIAFAAEKHAPGCNTLRTWRKMDHMFPLSLELEHNFQLLYVAWYQELNLMLLERWPSNDAYRMGFHSQPQGAHWLNTNVKYREKLKPQDLFLCSFCFRLKQPDRFHFIQVQGNWNKGSSGVSRDTIYRWLDFIRDNFNDNKELKVIMEMSNGLATMRRCCLKCYAQLRQQARGQLVRYPAYPDQTFMKSARVDWLGDRVWRAKCALICERCLDVVPVADTRVPETRRCSECDGRHPRELISMA